MLLDVTYSQILANRRDARLQNFLVKPLYAESNNMGGYTLTRPVMDGIAERCILEPGDELTHFTTYVLPYCNYYDKPVISPTLKTHDFSNAATWDNSNSLYIVQPSSGREAHLIDICGKIETGLVLASGQTFNMCVWESLGSVACPTPGTSPTVFADVMYDPYNAVYTGWLLDPGSDDAQEFKTWIFFDTNVPVYYVTHFEFHSIDEMLDKAEFKENNNTIFIKYSYREKGVFLRLRSSLKERMEIFTNDNAIIPQGTHALRNVMSLSVVEYVDW